MMTLPSNPILRALVIVSTVAVVVCYGWLAARLLEPTLTVPAFISETFVRTAASRVFLYEEKAREFPRETERLASELSKLEPLVSWLGEFKRPVEIFVDEKSVNRSLVTSDRVEIGRDILLSRGQLSKSVLKAWILQNGSSSLVSSHLRVDVASDVLLAMLEGSLDLQIDGHELAFDNRTWWTYADTYKGVCQSDWRSLDLAALCDLESSKTVSELSFRQFLGSRIWKSYGAIGVTHRLEFVRSWIDALKTDRLVDVPTLREGWLSVVKGQLEMLLPAKLDPLLKERNGWQPHVDLALIVIDDKGEMSAPGGLHVVTTDLPVTHARIAMMTMCRAPLIEEVLKLPVDRVVWRPSCAKDDFMQVRPSALRLAIARGLASAATPIDVFLRENLKKSWFGLADAKWDARVGAYEVHGVIQAIDAYHLSLQN